MRKQSKATYKSLLTLCVSCLVAFLYLVFVAEETSSFFWDAVYKPPYDVETDYVDFLDVGQGDSILISSNGYNALIDFGNQFDKGKALTRKLRRNGVKELHCVIATHFDSDHIGGYPKVLQNVKVHNAVMPEFSKGSDDFDEGLYYSLNENVDNVYTAKPGTVINIGEFELTIIGYYSDEKDSNDRSLIIMADIKGVKFLFTGDAGEKIEKRLIDDSILVDCDIYKVGHHGSRNSNSEDFIRAISPEYAVISVGDNSYGHPHEEVLGILEKQGTKVFRTDVSGDIIFRVEEDKIHIETKN